MGVRDEQIAQDAFERAWKIVRAATPGGILRRVGQGVVHFSDGGREVQFAKVDLPMLKAIVAALEVG